MTIQLEQFLVFESILAELTLYHGGAPRTTTHVHCVTGKASETFKAPLLEILSQ